MGVLKDTLLQTDNRPVVIQDCADLVDREVARKKGVTGMMIKGGYKAFKAIKPSIVTDAVDILLDDFTAILDKFYDDYLKEQPEKTRPFDRWTEPRDKKLADDLLTVTDNLMERSNKVAIKKVYNSLRKVAERNVAEAVPEVSKLIMKHMG